MVNVFIYSKLFRYGKVFLPKYIIYATTATLTLMHLHLSLALQKNGFPLTLTGVAPAGIFMSGVKQEPRSLVHLLLVHRGRKHLHFVSLLHQSPGLLA